MQTSVTFKNLDSSENLKTHIKEKLDRLDKLLYNPAEANVVLLVEKFRHIAEVSIIGDRLNIHGKEETNDMYSAIDMVIDKIEKQIKRSKDKMRSQRTGKKKGAAITQAEMILLQKLDLAELDMYRLAKELTIDLLKQWLVQYKFRNWTKTETRGLDVTDKMRSDRANEIAEALNDQERWGSHGRGISSRVLREELGLKIEDLEDQPEFWGLIRDYFWFLMDYCNQNGYRSFIHSRSFV